MWQRALTVGGGGGGYSDIFIDATNHSISLNSSQTFNVGFEPDLLILEFQDTGSGLIVFDRKKSPTKQWYYLPNGTVSSGDIDGTQYITSVTTTGFIFKAAGTYYTNLDGIVAVKF